MCNIAHIPCLYWKGILNVHLPLCLLSPFYFSFVPTDLRQFTVYHRKSIVPNNMPWLHERRLYWSLLDFIWLNFMWLLVHCFSGHVTRPCYLLSHFCCNTFHFCLIQICLFFSGSIVKKKKSTYFFGGTNSSFLCLQHHTVLL